MPYSSGLVYAPVETVIFALNYASKAGILIGIYCTSNREFTCSL